MSTTALLNLRPWRALVLAASLAIACSPAASPAVPADSRQAIAEIVETFARPTVEDGRAIGVVVGVTFRNRPPQFFSYGVADFDEAKPVTADTIFEIGSVTKVFTTALLGQSVDDHVDKLKDKLSDFPTLLGPMIPSTGKVTLLQLGDFTASFPTLPPLCFDAPAAPGCLPNARPTVAQYGAQDLLDYFRAYTAPRVPAPYVYSDISTGLIGLMLGSQRQAPMDDGAVQGWFDLVTERLIDPLGMVDTFLWNDSETAAQKQRLAGGYVQALASASVSSGGVISNISLASRGARYTSVPEVHIVGGGGSGAIAHAVVLDNEVDRIEIANGGQGYVAPAVIAFQGGDPTTPASGQAVISQDQVVGVILLQAGGGYSRKHPPTVTISGGNTGASARNAVLGKAYVSNGGVDYVDVIDGGSGYRDPLAVTVDPGTPVHNIVPVWAPAGALKSSARDMLRLVEAALGHRVIDGNPIDRTIVDGFRIAMKPYACAGPEKPCTTFSALAWDVATADNGMPEVISKNGGLTGFSSEIRVAPDIGLGIVALVNSRQTFTTGKPAAIAARISDNILGAIVRQKLK